MVVSLHNYKKYMVWVEDESLGIVNGAKLFRSYGYFATIQLFILDISN